MTLTYEASLGKEDGVEVTSTVTSNVPSSLASDDRGSDKKVDNCSEREKPEE